MDKFQAYNPATTPSKGAKHGELVTYTVSDLQMKLGDTQETGTKRHHGYYHFKKGEKK